METGLIIVLGLLGASSLTAIAIFTACFFLYCVRPHTRKRHPKRMVPPTLISINDERLGGRYGRKAGGDTTPRPLDAHTPSNGGGDLSPTHRDALLAPERLAVTPGTEAEDEEELEEGENCFLGKLHFSVAYHRSHQELIVTVLAAEGLRPPYADLAPLNPFATILIFPDTRHKVATKIMRRTRDPRWDEVFVFEGFPHSHLMGRELVLTVKTCAGSMGPAKQTIGEVKFSLTHLQRSQSDSYTVSLAKFLQSSPLPPLPAESQPPEAQSPDDAEAAYRGEIEVALCYIPGVARLRVGVIRARNLCHSLDILALDSFVQVDLIYRRAVVGSHRTTVTARTEHPAWNECFDFHVPPPNVKDVALKLEVFRLVENSTQTESLGLFRIGPNSGSTTAHHWASMLRDCGKTVTASHLLLLHDNSAPRQ